jgi:hypothetical protein
LGQHFWVDFAVETGRIQEPVHLVDLGLERDKEASIVIEQWCKQYNTVRPESALGYRPPTPETSIPMDHKPPMH